MILVANSGEPESFGPGVWLSASKDLENKSDDLRDKLCAMMKSMSVECGEPLVHDMRTFYINTENVRKSTRLYDFFALNFLNEGTVGCLKNAVTEIGKLPISTNDLKCVFKPLIDLIELSLKMTLSSVKLVRRVHYQTKHCLARHPRAETSKCLIALHANGVMRIVKSLVQLVRSVTKAVIVISEGTSSNIAKCSVQETLEGSKDMTLTAAKFGNCVLCVFTRICK